MTTQVIFRTESDLKEKFDLLARQEGKTSSEVLREMMEKYVKDRNFGAYIDHVWDTIGKELKARGVKETDLVRTLKEVRRKK